jgi:hypothetical protein
MNTKLAAVASAILATASLASAAEAGGGVRLPFGGPLGTFVATPSHGGGGGGGYHNKPSKRPPVLQAARKPDKPARIVKASPTNKVEETKVEQVTAAPSKTEETTSAATGSSALIQGSIPADSTDARPDTASHEPPALDSRVEAPAETVTAHTDNTPDGSGCKKFVPAIGTTVSVGCGD